MSSSILTEGRVSSKILSFAPSTFLFTGLVCKSWRENAETTRTGVAESIESLSRLEVARKNGINPYLASYFTLKNDAEMSIIRKLNEKQAFWERQDLAHAAEKGRIDVLEFMREKGYVADERVLHTAVRCDRPAVVEYLLGVRCPVDRTAIEWGFGPYIADELRMRSMEVAISANNLPMVKILCSVDYPFTKESFVYGCDTEDAEMILYLIQRGCKPPTDLFRESVDQGDYFTLGILIDNGLLQEEWDLWGCVTDDKDMLYFLLKRGIVPTDDDVDSAICAGNLGIAQYLTSTYRCRPTPLSYMLVFENMFCDCHFLAYLNWLYDDMHCSLGFASIDDMLRDARGSSVLDGCSSNIEDWFRERLSCKYMF